MFVACTVNMNNNRIIKKPRVKGIKEDNKFWCYYHKRFFDEEKRTTHCIPNGCFEFNRNYYTWRMCTKKDNDIECSGFGDREEIREGNVRKEIRLTDSQRRFLKKAIGREVKEVIIRGDLHSTESFDSVKASFDSINNGVDSINSHAVGSPEY